MVPTQLHEICNFKWILLTAYVFLPLSQGAAPKTAGNFELLYSIVAEDRFPVHAYKSLKTGIKVIIAENEGPDVNGYFSVATENESDEGLGHAITRMILYGSDGYPYKGVLEEIESRTLVSKIGAKVENDHVAFTISGTGSDGVLTILPVYLDHILFPTLSDSAYLLEVHHVTGTGSDNGKMFIDLFGRLGIEEAYLSLLRLSYPGFCGYSFDPLGQYRAVQDGANVNKVKLYHEKFFRPENLSLIFSGKIKIEDIAENLQQIEGKIASKRSYGSYTKPFLNSCRPLQLPRNNIREYPAAQEKVLGVWYQAWRGPQIKYYDTFFQLNFFLSYLTANTESFTGLLTKQLLKTDDPLAKNVVSFSEEFGDTLLIIKADEVNVEKLDKINEKVKSVLTAIGNGELLDIQNIKEYLAEKQRDVLRQLDDSEMKHEIIFNKIVKNVIYEDNLQDMDKRLNAIKLLEKLKSQDATFWSTLVKNNLVNKPSIIVKGVPSSKLLGASVTENMQFGDKRRETLGEEGLQKKGEELQAAKDATDKEIVPLDKLPLISIPRGNSIQFYATKRYSTHSTEQHPKFDAKRGPVFMHINHINSYSVNIAISLDTSDLNENQRLYVPFIIDYLMGAPIKRDGTVISTEDFSKEIRRDNLNIKRHFGFGPGGLTDPFFKCGPYCQTVFLEVTMDPKQYERGISVLHDLLYEADFNLQRVIFSAKRLQTGLTKTQTNSGIRITDAFIKDMLYVQNSNQNTLTVFRQFYFLNDFLKVLQSNDTDAIEKKLLEVRTVYELMANPNAIAVHLSTNFDYLASEVNDPVSAWNKFLPSGKKPTEKRFNFVPDFQLLKSQESGSNTPINWAVSAKTGCAMSGAVSNFVQAIPITTTFLDKDVAALLVYTSYMFHSAGPLGQAITYCLTNDINFTHEVSEGFSFLSIYNSNDITKCFQEIQNALKNVTEGSIEWNQPLLMAAKISAMKIIADRERTVSDAIVQLQMSVFRTVGTAYNQELIGLVAAMGINQLQEVNKKYMSALTDPRSSKIVLATDPRVIEIAERIFKEYGREMTIFSSPEGKFMNKAPPKSL